MRLFIFGLGYTAGFIARDFARAGATVTATVRSRPKAELLSAEGYTMHVFAQNERDPAVVQALGAADALLVSIPPRTHDPALETYGEDIARAPNLRWIGYLSTVGVYGDHAGAWIDETTAPRQGGERSRHRLEAEQGWLALGSATGIPVQLFRLAGIYGPGRNQLVQIADGGARRIVKPGQVFNRIHVDDIAQVIRASLARPRAGAIYNLADDEPAPPQDVVAFAAALCGAPPPPEIPYAEADLSEMARSFYEANRRVRNRLLKEELGVTLRYPSYREGLAALRAAGEGPP